MSVSEYLHSILRSWVALALCTVLGGAVGYALSASSPDQYRSTSSVLLTSDRGSTTVELVQGTSYVQNLVATYVVLASSEIVLAPVIEELGLDTTTQALAARVTASARLNTLVIDVSVTSWSRAEAPVLADAITRSLTQVVTEEVSPTTAEGTATVRLTTIQSATDPRYPFAPNTRMNTLIGLALGLILGVAFAVIRSALWNTVRSAADIGQITAAAPILGEIVDTKKGVTLPRAVLSDTRGIEIESVRSVAANLNFLKLTEPLRSFVVTSAGPGESKSSVVTALGIALAESGKSVLIVDADLRHPSLNELTGLEGSVGLTSVLTGGAALDDARQAWGAEGLHVLTTGPIPPNPSQVLASQAMREFIAYAQEFHDIVIVDSAPLLSVTDAKWLGDMTDGVVIVTRYKKTRTRALSKLVDALEVATVPVLGAIITRVPRRVRARYGNANYGEESATTRV